MSHLSIQQTLILNRLTMRTFKHLLTCTYVAARTSVQRSNSSPVLCLLGLSVLPSLPLMDGEVMNMQLVSGSRQQLTDEAPHLQSPLLRSDWMQGADGEKCSSCVEGQACNGDYSFLSLTNPSSEPEHCVCLLASSDSSLFDRPELIWRD